MEGFIKYGDLKSEKISSSFIYNPQKVAGKSYKVQEGGKKRWCLWTYNFKK
jgi:hypothetical protein